VIAAGHDGYRIIGRQQLTPYFHFFLFSLKNFSHIRIMGIPIMTNIAVAAILTQSIYPYPYQVSKL